MGKRLLFIYNPYSGKTIISEYVAEIIDECTKAGYDVIAVPTQEKGYATKKVVEYGEIVDHIICSGGDGTLNETINGLMRIEDRPTLGYIPTGSTNDFANSLSIPKTIEDAVDVAINGEEYVIDIGLFNKRNFVYIAAFGAFTEVSYSTSQDLKNVLGHPAYLLEGIRSLPKLRNYHVVVDVDGEIIEDDFLYAMITNATSAGGFKGITGKDVSLNDGIFELLFVKSIQGAPDLNEILGVLSGFKEESDRVIKRKAKHVKVISSEKIPWTVDGEFAGNHKEVEISVIPSAIEIKS